MENETANPLRTRSMWRLCVQVLLVVTLFVAITVGLLERNRQHSMRLVCGSNLKGIATSWKIYGGAHPESKRPALAWMVAKGHVQLDATICPTGRPPKSNYVFLFPKLTKPLDNRSVVAYEPKSNHDGVGGNVVFADGHGKFVTGNEYDHLIAAVKAKDHQLPKPTAKEP